MVEYKLSKIVKIRKTIKIGLLHSKKVDFICLNESPLRIMKNLFNSLFHLKCSFVNFSMSQEAKVIRQ